MKLIRQSGLLNGVTLHRGEHLQSGSQLLYPREDPKKQRTGHASTAMVDEDDVRCAQMTNELVVVTSLADRALDTRRL